MIAIIDNYDSFVFNIARYFRELGEATEVIRNDAISVGDLGRLRPCAVVISPGPCTPTEAGISTAIVRELSGHIPILGICLGHQCIGSAFGGRVVRARRPMHGRASHVTHDGQGLFNGLPSPFCVGRYHSLIVELDELRGSPLTVGARSVEGEIMALAHRQQPTYGINTDPIWARAVYKLPAPCKDVMRVKAEDRVVVHIPHPNQLKKTVSCGSMDTEQAALEAGAAGRCRFRYIATIPSQ